MADDGAKVLRLVSGAHRTDVGDRLRELAAWADEGRVRGVVAFYPLDENDFAGELIGNVRFNALLEAFERFKFRQLAMATEDERSI